MLPVVLSPSEILALAKQDPRTKRRGGFQGLLVSMCQRTASSGFLVLTAKDLERIPRYAFDYGNGGWEDRLQSIFGRHLGENLGR